MWPWEHAILGYLVFSLFCRAYYRESPGASETLAVVVGSVFPDLIDKPLAWEFHVFETGYALGHSLFFALPLVVLIYVLARTHGRPRVGLGFGVGYLLHLPADIVDTYVREGVFSVGIILWPLANGESHGHYHGFQTEFMRFFSRYQRELLSGELSAYLWIHVGIAAFTVVLWLYDGAPVLREITFGLRRMIDKVFNL